MPKRKPMTKKPVKKAKKKKPVKAKPRKVLRKPLEKPPVKLGKVVAKHPIQGKPFTAWQLEALLRAHGDTSFSALARETMKASRARQQKRLEKPVKKLKSA